MTSTLYQFPQSVDNPPRAGISLRLPATRPLHPACPPPSARGVAATPLLLASQTASDNSSPVSESSLASFRAASSSPSGPSGLLHRGERFCSHWSAVLHFGPAPDSIPACWINRRIREAFPRPWERRPSMMPAIREQTQSGPHRRRTIRRGTAGNPAHPGEPALSRGQPWW